MPPEIQKPTPFFKRKSFFLILFVLLLTGAGGYYYYFLGDDASPEIQDVEPDMSKKFQEEYQEAVDIAAQRDDMNLVVESFRKTLVNAPDEAEAAKAKVLLAGNLFYRNEGGDRNEAMQLYKEVALDESLTPYVRALALNNMANVVLDQDVYFYQLYLTEAPFDSFMPASGTNEFKVAKAYFSILNLSDSIYPTSYAKYAIAGNYYAPGLANIEGNTRIERFENKPAEEVATLVQKYVSDGDALDDESLHVLHINLQKYLYRALALNASGRILGNISLEDREEAFAEILLKGLEKNGSDQLSEAVLLRVRLYYANFLVQNFEEERNETIQTILRPFMFVDLVEENSYTRQSISDFYLSKMSSSGTNVIKQVSPTLTEISPEFKAFSDGVLGVKNN